MNRLPHVTRQTLSWTMHFRKTLNLAIPLALGQLIAIGINTTDIIAMGQLGTHELAAGSLAARCFQPFFFIGMGLMLTVGPLVAQGLGGNDDHLVRGGFRQGLFLAVAVGLVFILPIAGRHTVLIWLGQDADILAYVINFFYGWPLAFLLYLYILLLGNMSFRMNGQFHRLWQPPLGWAQISSPIIC